MRIGRVVDVPRSAVLAVAVSTVLVACGSSGGSDGPVAPTSSGTSTTTTSTDVSFRADGTTTYATLEVPPHRAGQRLAAALLIPGSGPTDRDGNDTRLGVTAGTLKIIADDLAAQGIASLRYDKYFAGRTGAGAFSSKPAAITIQDFFSQAGSAYQFLARQPTVDSARLLVVGHSEGGMIALQVATTVSPKPAGLALLEPQDRRILDLIRIQANEYLDTLVAQGTLSADQARANSTLITQAIMQFRAGAAPSTAGMASQVVQFLAPILFTPDNVTFERTNDAVVPAALAARVASGTRVLVTEGTRDMNVPPRTAGPLIQALHAAGTTGPGLVVLQGTDHLMHLATQPDTAAVLAPDAVAAIRNWALPFAA